MGIYLIKTTLCLTLFYLTYRLLIHNKCHFAISRYYLIGSFVLSFLVPFITINLPLVIIHDLSAGGSPFSASAGPLHKAGGFLLNNEYTDATHDRISPLFLLTIAYSTGTMIFAIRYALSIFRLVRMVHRNRKQPYREYTLVCTENQKAPFSFFRYIFISSQDISSGDFRSFVLKHELTHIRNWHSLDHLLLGLGQIIQWFNPVVLFYKKAVIALHEYSADYTVIENQDSISAYQLKIMQYAYAKNDIRLTSQLSYTITKNRFNMMTQRNPGRLNVLRLFMTTIMTAFLLLAFSSGDKILIKSDPENNWQRYSMVSLDNNAIPIAACAGDTVQKSRPQEKDTAETQKMTKDEDIRILSDELQEMKKEYRPDSGFCWFHAGPAMHLEFFRQHMAENQAHWTEKQRHMAELQRQMAELHITSLERLRPPIKGLPHGPEVEELRKIAEEQARIEHFKPMPDEMHKNHPPVAPFVFNENHPGLKDLPPFIEHYPDNFSFPHPHQFESLNHLNETGKELLEKQKQWQEKFSREMEKQHRQLENKRKQLLEEYRHLMKKYVPEG